MQPPPEQGFWIYAVADARMQTVDEFIESMSCLEDVSGARFDADAEPPKRALRWKYVKDVLARLPRLDRSPGPEAFLGGAVPAHARLRTVAGVELCVFSAERFGTGSALAGAAALTLPGEHPGQLIRPFVFVPLKGSGFTTLDTFEEAMEAGHAGLPTEVILFPIHAATFRKAQPPSALRPLPS